INVQEYGDGAFRGFSLSTMLGDQSIQQIAEIQFQQHPSGVTFQIHGNPEIYGPNYYIRSAQPMSIGQAVLLAWMFTPNRVAYVPRYNRFYLPPSYVAVRVVPVIEYRKVTKTVVTTTSIPVQQVSKPVIQATVQSPNVGKSSPAIVAPLAKPTEMQKQFQARPETKKMQQATGFANPSSNPAAPAVPKKHGLDMPPVAPIVTPAPAGKSALPATTVTPQPTTTHPTAMDKGFKPRPQEKEMKGATGFASPQIDPAVPAPTTPRPASAPAPTVAAPKKESAPVVTPTPTPHVVTPKAITPQPQTVAPRTVAPTVSTPAPTPRTSSPAPATKSK
ncbi:MAG: hypothetical protein AAB972_01605, partial [Patescibacteria group bacterium]